MSIVRTDDAADARARVRSPAMVARVAWIGMLVAAVGCDAPAVVQDASTDARTRCGSDTECGDGVFCNGVERCAPDEAGADARGCVGGAPPCDGECDESADACASCPDADGDGHADASCGGDDCDDGDPERYPGNAEVCDDVDHDEDCDPSTFGYRNEDGDAFVDAACCNIGTGGARICGDDCDDTRGGINPEATEACDGVDNDCDGMVDEGLGGAWWPDCDGDRFGRTGEAPVTTCAPPAALPAICTGASARWADVDGDCDDENASRHPAASEECNGIDDDCDGMLDGPGEDADGDGVASLTCGGADCDDSRAEVYPGAPELCDGLDNDCDGAREDADGDLHLAVGEACSGGALDALARDDCDDSDAAIHPGATEVCNGADDDCDTVVDDEPDASASCPSPDGSAACVSGACAAVSCPSGRDDCDGDSMNGCEVTLASDRVHCGACDATCAFACSSGACEDAVQVSAYGDHTCARFASGRVACWGAGDWGRLGNGSTADSPTPVYVSGLTDAIDVCAGHEFTCAVRAGGQAQCWGEGSWGQLGEGDFVFVSRSTPVDVVRGGGTARTGLGSYHHCGVRGDGTVYCVGANHDGQLGRAGWEPYGIVADVPGVSGAVAIAGGFSGTCVVLSGGGVSCWGARNYLGDGSTGGRYTPGPVSGLTDAVAIDLSFGSFACAARTGGGVRCWGENTYGQLGDGTFLTNRSTPVDVVDLSGAVDVATGRSHTCAVTSSGSVYCWGDNDHGQLGDGTTTRRLTPVLVPGIADAVDVACGITHTCVAHASGGVSCWGGNSAGQLGDGTTTRRLSPVRVVEP